MNHKLKKYLATGFILTALAVAFGAFGAHGLKNVLSEHYLGVYETANKYHFIHSVGLIVTLYMTDKLGNERACRFIFVLFILGLVLFSGSLYMLSLADFLELPGLKILGAVAPIGGLSFIAAWLYAGILFLKR